MATQKGINGAGAGSYGGCPFSSPLKNEPRTSLPRLLQEHRGVRNRSRLPKFTVRRIVAWTIGHYVVDSGIEEFCRRYSASRLVFGSGYPENSSGAAMLAMAQAELSVADRQAIASGNLSRLLAEAILP